MEVFESLNRDGIYCNLITGQERKMLPGALHTSSTVEMISLDRHYDVAVIDEIQMIKDENRGYAWTRALLGLAANELHLCGDTSVITLVKELSQKTKEELEVHYYDRFTPLKVDSEHFESYKEVQAGDCIVAFSRTEIYQIKQMIEYHTNYKVCVVYGALPPEARRHQANLFNQDGNGYDIMVASDAIGMGLNLNIRRIIFHSLSKYNGDSMESISDSQIKQISGRAGRKNSIYPDGKVTCLVPSDIPLAKAALESSSHTLSFPKAGLFPEIHHIEAYANQLGTLDLLVPLRAIKENSLIDGNYFPTRSSDPIEIVELLQEVPLSFRDRYIFSIAPVETSNPELMTRILEYATLYSKGTPVACRVTLPKQTPMYIDDLKPLETLYQIVSLWLWLSFRFGERHFPSRGKAEKLLESITVMFRNGLLQTALSSASRSPFRNSEGPREQNKVVFRRKRTPLELKPFHEH
eukprot:g5800.t1